jgi:hypothetical protein
MGNANKCLFEDLNGGTRVLLINCRQNYVGAKKCDVWGRIKQALDRVQRRDLVNTVK